jgi:tRNA-splicing endonuclease subunit Sen54
MRNGAAPKRDEKDFEPVQGGGSGLQRHNLERTRSAMFDALRSTTRTISRFVHPSILECAPPALAQ